MTSIPSGTPAHPLSPRRRWGRVLLVVVGLVVLWDIDPEYVDNLGTWLGIVTVLAPEIFIQRRDEPPGNLSIAL
ncbi:hypothetical protein [Streptomyces sp. NPDC092952]|uniref:hypothetical protein n=1 Tax=Streptomyces sp. NPDC092952 TaxID=3366018 RepID=UPI0038277F68